MSNLEKSVKPADLIHSDDVAAEYLLDDEHIDPAAERRVLWKIDLVCVGAAEFLPSRADWLLRPSLMPLMTVSYGLQYVRPPHS